MTAIRHRVPNRARTCTRARKGLLTAQRSSPVGAFIRHGARGIRAWLMNPAPSWQRHGGHAAAQRLRMTSAALRSRASLVHMPLPVGSMLTGA